MSSKKSLKGEARAVFIALASCVVDAIFSGWSPIKKSLVLRASRFSLDSCACNWLLSEGSMGVGAVRGGDGTEMEVVDLFFTLNSNQIHKALWLLVSKRTIPPP